MKKLIAIALTISLMSSTFSTAVLAADKWVQENNTWHVYQDDQMIKKDWYQDNSKWYYLDNHGEITTGWIFIDHIWYYMGTDGVMKTGWQLIDNTWYYFRNNGQMFKGWLQTKSGAPWYYLNSSGKMVVGWQQIDGKWYYFDNTGKMLKNTTVDGSKLGADGAMVEKDTQPSTTKPSDSNISYSTDDVIAKLRNKLKNPNSLIINAIIMYQYDSDTRIFGIDYSAMNGFGGYTRDNFMVVAFSDGTLIDEKEMDFATEIKYINYIRDHSDEYEAVINNLS